MKQYLLLISISLSVMGCAGKYDGELTERQQAAKIERCKELKKQIEKLKGSPVRRTTAREYYAKECLQ